MPIPVLSTDNILHTARAHPLSDFLTFGLLNICSILHKSSIVADIISEHEFDIFAITEFWHSSSDDISLKMAAPPVYTIVDVARDCPTYENTINHGGIVLFCRSIFRIKRVRIAFCRQHLSYF